MRRWILVGCALVVWCAVYLFRAAPVWPIRPLAEDIELLPARTVSGEPLRKKEHHRLSTKRRARVLRAAAAAPPVLRVDDFVRLTPSLVPPPPVEEARHPLQIHPPGDQLIVIPMSRASPTRRVMSPSRMPKKMSALYAAFAGLETADAGTTIIGLKRGAREANPLLRGAVTHSAALIGVKAASALGTMYTVERLRERHPRAAFVTMAAIDAVYVAVVLNNSRVIQKSSR